MTTSTSAIQPTRWVMFAMVAVVVTAFSSQMALPLWVGAIIDDYGLTPEEAGIIAAFEYAAVAIVSVAIALKLHRFNPRTVTLIGMLCLLAGNAGATFATEYTSLLAARGLAGFGKGLVIAAIFALAARTPNPTKSFAIVNGAYSALATIIYFTLPAPINAYGAVGAFACLFVVAFAGSLLIWWVPTAKAVGSEAGVSHSADAHGGKLAGISLSGFLVLLALILMWTANGSVWTYVERIGQGTGLSLQTVGTILSFAAAFAVLGPIAAHTIHDRFGFRVPITIGAILKISAALILCNVAFPGAYIVAAPLFVFAALFIVPYLMSLMSLADPTGRLAAAAGGLLTAGSSLGAYLGGVTLTYSNLHVLSILAAGLLVAVILLVQVAVAMMKRKEALA